MAKERVAGIIRQVRFGLDDRDRLSLEFALYTSESTAAGQGIRDMDLVAAMLRDAGVSEVKDLEGKPCWAGQGDGLIVFEAMWKEPR